MKLTTEQTKHNLTAKFMADLLPKLMEILEKYNNGKKSFKVDGYAIAKLNNEIQGLRNSYDSNHNFYLSIRYGGYIELRTKTSFKADDYWVYDDSYLTIGLLDELTLTVIKELKPLEDLLSNDITKQCNIQQETSLYYEAEQQTKDFFEMYEALPYRVKEQLKEKFWRLK